MNSYDAGLLVYGAIYASPYKKQIIGRALAEHLGYTPGPAGKDGSVDGAIVDTSDVLIAHFQSKLSSVSLTIDEGKILHSDLIRLKPQICIYIAGVGYDSSFLRLISTVPAITAVHLLTLKDVFMRSPKFNSALQLLPSNNLAAIDWSRFHI
ncbi:hypothetical protein JWR97_05790 [Pseudomonas cedrina subsp. fulgida]|nr:hypothetical protein [Pseudomonas cedrina subsp. fulgida]